MVQINYSITLGNTTYTPTSASRLLQIQTNAALQIPANHCILVLSASPTLSLALEDPMTIDVGYGETRSRIFSGKISHVRSDLEQVIVTGESEFRSLVSTRLNCLFEQSNAGEIAKHLIQTASKLKIGKIETGLRFPTYTVGDRQTVWDNLQHLAQQCGFDFYANVQDQVVFAEYAPQQTHVGRYGQTLLAIEQFQQQSSIVGVEVYGESPISQGQGEQSYAWFAKKEVKGKAGKTATAPLRVIDPTARTQDIVSKIATTYLKRHTHIAQGRVKLLGLPAAKLGDAIQLADLPNESQNGTFKITAVTHSLSLRSGFYTQLEWEKN
ncbi:MAG: hypothetical protein KME10_19665 [Plectolyngbya sp. WJT66-NPBG17]|jgi:hypothetical protein|nr:hypothetical protein [Plectolyngbya sp. WJT66-NPBG17]